METNNIEKLVEQLRSIIPFKEGTEKGDIVLVIAQDPRLILYGLVTSVEQDKTRKDEWWHVGVTFFTIPLQKVIWTLRTAQMTGREIFTMGGEKRFFQAVVLVEPAQPPKEKMPIQTDGTSRKAMMKRIK